MNEGDEERQRVREIFANSKKWWWSVYKLFESDKNSWNQAPIYELLELNWYTWNDTTEWKLFVFDRKKIDIIKLYKQLFTYTFLMVFRKLK